jgi:hypothetical protein
MQKGDLNFLSPEACFAAGTLVHTKNGLKPIEQIKVGDLVLSKHESGKGERAVSGNLPAFFPAQVRSG